jgi:hypothetical protein|tara:strand:- start:384 stop:704 length:321 start_codon:yes stop_codon:yes gene_type:complete
MITISIEPADNGIIKFLFDDNVNGGGEEYTSRTVYEFEGQKARTNQIKFLKELVMDLGLSTGTQLDSNELLIKSEWGVKYQPNQKEIKQKIMDLESQLKFYRSRIE